MVKWINRSVIAAPRNGTTSHTITFTAATAGNLLVAVIEGAVTHTVPTGWTRQARGLQSTEIAVWTKTATAGESSFSTTHNGSNYPIGVAVYEFPAGSTFLTAAGQNGGIGESGGANPLISGLTGTNLLMAATGNVPGSSPTTVTWQTPAGIVSDYFISVPTGGLTDGYALAIAYVEDSTSTGFQPTSNATFTSGQSREGVTWAVNVPAGGGGAAQSPAPDFIASPAVVYTPTATSSTAPAPGFISSPAALYTPTATTSTSSSPGFIASPAVLYDPAVTQPGGAQSPAPGFIASPAALYPPAATTAVSPAPGFIGSPAAVYAPAAQQAGAGAQSVGPDFLPSLHQLFAPAVVAAQFATPDFLTAWELYPPAVRLPTLRFTTPTVAVVTRLYAGSRALRQSYQKGQTVWRDAAGWHQTTDPEVEDLAGADRLYRGGRLHTITADQAAELTAAGYGTYITQE